MNTLNLKKGQRRNKSRFQHFIINIKPSLLVYIEHLLTLLRKGYMTISSYFSSHEGICNVKIEV